MFYKIVLVSRRNDDGLRIRDELERNRLYDVELIDTAPAALERLKKPDVNCMLLNLDSFTSDKTKLVTDLRNLGLGFPIIVTSQIIQPEAYQLIQSVPKTVILEKPFESKDLWGITQKMVQGQHVAQRIHRRFYTNQAAQFEKQNNGQIYSGRVYNLSKGGAYVEFDQGRLQTGDLVKMSVMLNKINKSYNVDAEVVWSANAGLWKGKPAAGVRFLQAGDVYRNLLGKL